MFVVGLTGGIGSGKTAVSDRLATLGIDIIDADVAARVVVEPGTQALAQIIRRFGDKLLLDDGSLDRAALRAIVFGEPGEKTWLENLLHPLIGSEIFHRLEHASSPYALFVSPLLIEAGQVALCDRVVVVDVPESLQLSRAASRDKDSEAQLKRIMASQLSRKDRLAAATDIIDNSGNLEQLIQAVDALHDQFLTMAAEKARNKHE